MATIPDAVIEAMNEALGGDDPAADVRAALAAAEGMGWKLVPKDSTERMVEEGRKAMAPETFVSHARVIWTWDAMYDAAPSVKP